jgi:N-acetylmuramoyl-L-alanine amidase
MDPTDYQSLSELSLLELCVWREARNQGSEGMRAVAWSIRNRVQKPSWWGHDWKSVILKPWQYSSFNANDPNNEKWPDDQEPAFVRCCEVCTPVYLGSDTLDDTDGATHYYDTSIEFPKAWGSESEWVNTLNIGKLRFWKMREKSSNREAVSSASAGEE